MATGSNTAPFCFQWREDESPLGIPHSHQLSGSWWCCGGGGADGGGGEQLNSTRVNIMLRSGPEWYEALSIVYFPVEKVWRGNCLQERKCLKGKNFPFPNCSASSLPGAIGSLTTAYPCVLWSKVRFLSILEDRVGATTLKSPIVCLPRDPERGWARGPCGQSIPQTELAPRPPWP